MSKSIKQSSKTNNTESRVFGEKSVKSGVNSLSVYEKNPSAAIIAGFIIGLLIMYITGLLV
jgi:zinc transporter, ZIP family